MDLQHFGLRHPPLGKEATELWDDGTLAQLDERFQWLLHSPGVGLLTGDAGVGKTAALRLLTAKLNPHRYQVIYHAETDQPKAWLNQQLEHSPVPAIWISNSIEAINDAFLRRFAFHIEFRTPPKAVRERIISRCVGNTPVSDRLVSSLAADDSLSPAQVNQASRFASLCHANPGQIDESAFLQAIKSSQAAMGRSYQTSSQLADTAPCNFAYLNLDSEMPVAKIEQALRRHHAATLWFYGIPGAGKTCLARHLADAIGRPLMIRRASDLLGKYVGESEKRIARMVRDASQEGALLLLDEADSFLRSRQQAHNSWEVTQVNELLQQMEAFDGIFIVTVHTPSTISTAGSSSMS